MEFPGNAARDADPGPGWGRDVEQPLLLTPSPAGTGKTGLGRENPGDGGFDPKMGVRGWNDPGNGLGPG